MRILFLSPYPASLLRSRLYGFVKYLAEHHSVEMLALCTSSRELADARALQQDGLTIITHSESLLRASWRSIRALTSQQPLQVAYCASPHLQTLLQQRIQHGAFDLLHVENIRALGILPASVQIPVVWDAVDCISQLYMRGGQMSTSPLKRLLFQHEAARLHNYENTQLRRFPQVLVTAERERQALLTIAHTSSSQTPAAGSLARINVLPHGIDQRYFQPYSGKRERDLLVFSGKMSFHANVLAAYHLAREIMPRIWRHRPDVRLIIAGSDPPASVRLLAGNPNIEVTGHLPDMRLVISQARIAVCPLPYASGIQNKVLEAMALGTPVIASKVAADGLQAIPGQDLLVADDPELFATAVLRLLEDQTLWSSLSAHGVTYVTTHHNWQTIIQKLTAVYQQAITACR